MREEVRGHVLKANGCHGCCYLLFAAVKLRIIQVGIKISCHQQLCPAGELSNGQDNALNHGLVVGYDVTPSTLVPAQDVPYALILWYVSKIIYLS